MRFEGVGEDSVSTMRPDEGAADAEAPLVEGVEGIMYPAAEASAFVEDWALLGWCWASSGIL